MFAFAVLVAASRLAAAHAFGEAFTLRDSLLPGHDYKTIKGAGWLNCQRTCISETRCLSYNYFKATNEKDNICEMNDRAMDNSCDTKGHLISSPGWFYNQVKRNVKNDSVDPGENRKPKSYKSCKKAYDAGERDDQAYELELDYGKTRVYCHMSSIPGCGSGGYTLVMKIDGSAPTFLYDSALWTNRTAYNVPGGSSLDASEETKLPTYWETPFSRICLGMTVGGQTNYLAINYTADSLFALIADGQYRATTLGRDAWKALISGSSLQVNCNKEGFNAWAGNPRAARARIGITSNDQNECRSNDSQLGFGTGSWPKPNSCGNAARHGGDNGDKTIAAVGYIFVQ